MVTIKVKNIYTKLENIDKELEIIIREKLSYQIQEFKQEYIHMKYLYDRRNHTTYTGLLSYVIDILNDAGEEYEIVDLRTQPQQTENYEIQKEFTPRDYQQKVIDECENREIIRAATGAGKTFMMAGLIAKFKTKPVAIFADKLSLCTQLQSEIGKFLNEPVGLVGGGINNKQDITVYSVQSVQESDVKDANMVLFDECFTEDTLVNISEDKYVTIKDIVDNKLDIKIPSYNIQNKQVEYKQIINWGKKQNKQPIYEVEVIDEQNIVHKIKCTENHKIFVNNKYVEVKDIKEGDEVVII